MFFNFTLIIDAIRFAEEKHRGQVRKYTGVPYITHPLRVAQKTTEHYEIPSIVAAAVLHDVIEDCAVTPEEIESRFGVGTKDLVMELTNPSKQHPKLSRAEKKKMDREHLKTVSRQAKIIKMIDRIDNLNEINEQAPISWIKKYIQESILLAEELKDADKHLYHTLLNAIQLLRNKFNV